ncbi:MAG TPA: DeoR/GlpR family DNA-binding transcription regulator [Roseiarcus sp.]|nr:DeoR/GlpR family DNA-binding transcription regulator [Roseiarcus sp.]
MSRGAAPFFPDAGTAQGRAPAGARHVRILELVDRNGFVSVADIAESFSVSDMTIRRDLGSLESKGMIVRTHGGAVGVGRREVFDAAEPAFSSRRRQNAAAKAAIARAAAGLIGPRESIGIDVGTSTLALAEEIASRRDVTVFTSNLYAAAVLGRRHCPVHVLGGLVRGPELSVVGTNPREQIRQFYVAKLFLGVSGLTEDGFFDYSPEDTEIKRAFIEQAEQVIVLCDSSKFGHRSVSKVCGLDGVATLVTDRAPPPHLAEALARAKVQMIVCDSEKDLAV